MLHADVLVPELFRALGGVEKNLMELPAQCRRARTRAVHSGDAAGVIVKLVQHRAGIHPTPLKKSARETLGLFEEHLQQVLRRDLSVT
jgi:hypothetical protein